uniref:Secreted protein n=1 Tax=Mus musculus TaxID=10090 RepID=Q3U035_MOUSE|nr:unnamed protein product [Mus musculus]
MSDPPRQLCSMLPFGLMFFAVTLTHNIRTKFTDVPKEPFEMTSVSSEVYCDALVSHRCHHDDHSILLRVHIRRQPI